MRHVQALRLQTGESVRLFNGDGSEYESILIDISRRGVSVLIRACEAVERESPLAITLIQGVCANDRMDLVIQKATELGVNAIRPIVTSRSIVRLSSERQAKRAEHWQNVAIAACEQCGRNRIPEVRPAAMLHAFLALEDPGEAAATRLYLSPNAESGLERLPRPTAIQLLIGPEGGLSNEEIRDVRSRGFAPVRFGPRILRTETAPLAAIAAMQARWGDCG